MCPCLSTCTCSWICRTALMVTPLRIVTPSRERVQHDGGAFRIVLPKRHRLIEHGDIRAETPKRLRHFEAGPPGANDNEMPRTLGKFEDIFTGEIRRIGEPGNRRERRYQPVAMTKHHALM